MSRIIITGGATMLMDRWILTMSASDSITGETINNLTKSEVNVYDLASHGAITVKLEIESFKKEQDFYTIVLRRKIGDQYQSKFWLGTNFFGVRIKRNERKNSEQTKTEKQEIQLPIHGEAVVMGIFEQTKYM
ncbi:hypothetical protein [Aegicerativicinus sediminis]|uniref:hypothetical protein n=1 Tax=Aegicerativicinus sediminis TaxID=2893202 RepID=UPI001E4616B2|nr:hypothetical protein [Aegicerativicinus sediminis]